MRALPQGKEHDAMTQARFEATERVRLTAESRGEAGRAWLAGLHDQVAEIAARWDLTVGDSPPNGTEAFVAHVTLADGGAAILKLGITGIDATRQELRILRAADGRGYARLLRADERQNILLLEPLGPQLHRLGYAEEARMAAICATLKLAWRRPPASEMFLTAAQKADEMARVIGDLAARLPGAADPALVALALACARRRAAAFDPATAVLAHGDAHEWNTLSAPGSPSGFKFVDPDGAIAEPAYDLAVPMREWGPILPAEDIVALARCRCRWLSAMTGVDEAPIWEWSLVQCVWNGLLLKSEGVDAPGDTSLAIADAWRRAGVVA